MKPGDRVRVSDHGTQFWGFNGVIVGPGGVPSHWRVLLDGDVEPLQFGEAALERHPPDGAP